MLTPKQIGSRCTHTHTHKVPKRIRIVFHNGSTYDYHFIIKQLAEDFKGQFECLGENTEKYITFSVPIKEDDNSKKSYTN